MNRADRNQTSVDDVNELGTEPNEFTVLNLNCSLKKTAEYKIINNL